jgi:hypothetical protein
MGGRMTRRLAVVTALGAVATVWFGLPAVADAHALSARADLPIPAWLFAWGASLVLIVSFAALSVVWTKSRFEEEDWRPVSEWLSNLVVSPITKFLAGLIGALLLILTVATALNGTEAPDRNFSLTFVFVTVWLGGVLLSVLVGDFFRAFNPWGAIARAPAFVFRLVAGQAAQAPLRYPEWLGRWPAVGGLIGFGWIELVYSQTGFQAVGLVPHAVGIAILVYTAWTFLAMALFGIDVWLERGETFSVYFGMFSQLSKLEVRDDRLGVRRAFSAATQWAVLPGSVALVLTTIGITAFDGAQEGLLQTPILDTTNKLIDAGLGPLFAHRLTESFYLAGMIAVIAGFYWLGIAGMHTVRGSLDTKQLGRTFGHSFIPIALAYLTAHYFSLFVFQEQAQFTYILSDPFGTGHDYFGTASGGIDYGLIGSRAIWYVQVGALIAGHVTALVLAHDRAIKVYGDPRTATRSQYWMLALMVGFTTLGLFLLSQANA